MGSQRGGGRNNHMDAQIGERRGGAGWCLRGSQWWTSGVAQAARVGGQ